MTDEVKTPPRRARLLAVAWGGFLLLVTSWPNPPSIAAGGFPLDKVTHFFLYAVEALLLFKSVAWKARRGAAWPTILAVVGSMAIWGVIDETHQYWIPGRQMDSGDLFADLAGSVAGVAAAARRAAGRRVTAVTFGRSSGRRPRRS